jgi:hypothetical protein
MTQKLSANRFAHRRGRGEPFPHPRPRFSDHRDSLTTAKTQITLQSHYLTYAKTRPIKPHHVRQTARLNTTRKLFTAGVHTRRNRSRQCAPTEVSHCPSSAIMSVSSSSSSSTSARLAGLQRLLGTPSGVLVLDGGLATELEKDPRVQLDASPLWSAALLLDKYAHLQDAVVTAHKNYFLAGADVATTVSYQASVDGFRREGVESPDKVTGMFAQSVELGVQARDQAWQQLQSSGETASRIEPLVASSIGCYGAALADGSVRHTLIALLLLVLVADQSIVFQ